jgi:hypothetical protein
VLKSLGPQLVVPFWEVWTFRRWGLAGGSRSLGTGPWGYLVPGPSSLSLLPIYHDLSGSTPPSPAP